MNEREIKKLREEVKRLGEERKYNELIPKTTELINSEEEPLRKARAYCVRSIVRRNKGDYDDAIADCTKAIKLDPQYARAYLFRGLAYNCKGNYDRAIADYAKAIELDPKYTKIYLIRGLAYVTQDNYNRAIADYTVAIKLDPKYAEAYIFRGFAHSLQGNYDQAIEDYTQVTELSPKYAGAYLSRGFIYGLQGNYDRMIEDCAIARKISPHDPKVFFLRGTAYYKQKNYDRAVADYTTAIDLDREYAGAYYNRGITYAEKYEFALAFKDFNTALKNDPTLKTRKSFAYITSQISAMNKLEKDEQIKVFEIYCKLWRTVNEIRGKLFYKLEKPQTGVAHYTSLHALKNLFPKKGRFRLYNADYMNDPEEGQIFFKIMEDYKKDEKKESIKEIFYKDKDESYSSPAYIGSFVMFEEDDEYKGKLPLWRTYGKHDAEEATGACLIFKKQHIADHPQNQFGRMEELLQSSPMEEQKQHFADHPQNQPGRMEELLQSSLMGEQKQHFADYLQNQPGRMGDHNNVQKLELYEICYRHANQKPENIKNELKELTFNLEEMAGFISDLDDLNDEQDKLRELVCELLDSIRFLFKESYYSDEKEVRVIQLRYGEKGKSSESEIKPDVGSIPPRLYIEAPRKLRFSEVMLGPKAVHIKQWKKWCKVQDEDIKIYKSIIDYGNS